MAAANTARSFSTLYNLVATITQDTSTTGISNSKTGINNIILEITKMFRFPQQLVGWDKSKFITPSVSTGVQTTTIAVDVDRIEDVWWISNNSIQFPLEQIDNDQKWLERTDQNSQGDPLVFRVMLPDNNGNNTIQTWPGASSGWQSYSGGNLYYSYWKQLSTLVNDSDIPALPYELDTVLVNGGCSEVARMQGDSVLMKMFYEKYLDDLGEIRAWLINQRSRDGQLQPNYPIGVYGRDRQISGYRVIS